MFKVRDCAICLEPLLIGHGAASDDDDDDDDEYAVTESTVRAGEVPPPTPRQQQQRLTFAIPCGHVFHTPCYHAWNKAQMVSGLYNKKLKMMMMRLPESRRQQQQQHHHHSFALHCAACQTIVDKSYYLPMSLDESQNDDDDNNNKICCGHCGTSLYGGNDNEIVFDPATKTLRHAQCGGGDALSSSSHDKTIMAAVTGATFSDRAQLFPVYLASCSTAVVVAAVTSAAAPIEDSPLPKNWDQNKSSQS